MSFNRFERHDKTNLIGASDTATVANGFGLLGVTVHHNYYKHARQRMPRVRFGKVHVYDNVYQGELGDLDPAQGGTAIPRNRFLYGIGIGYLAKLVVENNVFRVQAPRGVEVPDGVMFFNWHKAAPTSGTGLDVGQKTYLQASGTVLDGVPKDLFAIAIANAAALAVGKPALESTDAVWSPASTYPYTLDPVETIEELVVRTAGANRYTD
jgi:pectate lyase